MAENSFQGGFLPKPMYKAVTAARKVVLKEVIWKEGEPYCAAALPGPGEFVQVEEGTSERAGAVVGDDEYLMNIAKGGVPIIKMEI